MQLTTAVLSLLPLLASSAPTRNVERTGCFSPSPVFTVHDLYYHSSRVFTTPAHQNPWGYVEFNLTSNVVDFTTHCSAASSQLSDFFYGNQWYQCDEVENGQSWFRYDRPTGRVDVNQTWTCTDAPDPIRFTASGNGTKTLTCQDSEYHNDDWQSGEIYATYTTECEKATFDIVPWLITAVA